MLQDGRTPLHKACERGCLAVGVMLLENQADVAALDMVRALRNHVVLIPWLTRFRSARWTARLCTPQQSVARWTSSACSRCTEPL